MVCLLHEYELRFSILLDAERVISKFLHKIDDKQIYAMHPKQEEDNKEENDKSVSGVEHGKMVEIHGDIEGLSKDSLLVYLESTRRSGGGVIDEIDLLANPPRIVFADSEGILHLIKSYVLFITLYVRLS